MRWSALLSTVALAVLAAADETSHVISLTSGDFDQSVQAEPLMLVEFFAPWCGHCKALAPQYEEAATTLKDKDIKLAKVDCVDQAELCQQHGVQGYPTLKVFRKGEPTDYTGPRKADGIVSYMVKQSLPAVSDVTAANLDEFQNADKIVAVAYLSADSEAVSSEFSATAEKHRDEYLFGRTTDPAAITAAGVTPPAIVLYRSFDEHVIEYPYPVADTKASDIEEWIKDLSIPLVDEVSGDNYALYAQSGKPLAYLFLDPSDENKDKHIELIRPVAAAHKGKVNFVWIDAVRFGDHARSLNLPEPQWPSFVLQDLKGQLKYPFDQSKEITAEALDEMLNQYHDGKLEPSLKSQPIPESQDESVFNLVGKQFDEVVFDDSKDVFVEFYASWCGHCKRLKPTWDSLGDHFADNTDRLTIAKMEAQENDLPPSVPFRIQGFPTLKFKPAGSRDFIDYEGDRSLESLISFVQENAKNSLGSKNESAPVEAAPVAADSHDVHDEL